MKCVAACRILFDTAPDSTEYLRKHFGEVADSLLDLVQAHEPKRPLLLAD
jgi:hypothetical protein